MITGLAFIVFLFLIGSVVCILLGIITPQSFIPLFKKNLGKKKTALSFLGISFGLFILLCVLAVNSSTTSTNAQQGSKGTVSARPSQIIKPTIQPTPTVKRQKVVQSKNPKPTSTPEMNEQCDSDHHQDMDFDSCLRKFYPLGAKVSADDNNFYVTNPTNVDWTDCNAQFDDGSFQMNLYDSFDVPSESTTSVAWGRLIDGNNNRFDYSQQQPEPLDISCTFNNGMHESQYQGF